MRSVAFLSLLLLPLASIPAAETAHSPTDRAGNRVLLIIVDGLRPDYVTPELMPNVHALGERGVLGLESSAVLPSFTRPNRVSIVTGLYPGGHGVVNNSLFHPDLEEPVSTASQEGMRQFEKVSGTPMVTARTLGEILDQNGDRLLTLGNGAWLMNHKALGKGYRESGGNFSSEEAFAEVTAAIGRPPRGGRGPDRTAWEVDNYLFDALSEDPAEVVLLWMGEPDAAGHTHGVGAPDTIEALRSVDSQIGRLLQAHEKNGLTERVNVFVTSDHGFTQNTGTLTMGQPVSRAGLPDHVAQVSSMVWITSGEEEHLQKLVETLQRDERIGNIYTRPATPGEAEGRVAGTLSTDLIRWNHERSSDLLFMPAWSDEKNEHGWPGTTTRRGTATHGSDSPFDLHIPLIGFGPDLKRGLRSPVPTGNVDFLPTILRIRGIDTPPGIDGRVLRELLADGPAPEEVEVTRETHRSRRVHEDGFFYEATLRTATVEGTRYFLGAETHRGEAEEANQ